MDDPAQPRSAMDGYAVAHRELTGARADRPVYLRAAGVIPAGRTSSQRLRPGEARRIMTGAPLPPGADAVVPVEQARAAGPRVGFTSPIKVGAHLRGKAENFRRGETLLDPQTLLRPQEVGLCITSGVARLTVASRIKVGVLATGSELVKPASRLRRGEVFDSNRPMVLAQVAATGAEAVDLGSISDRLPLLARTVRLARNSVDVLVTIGGVSAGDFDIVKVFLQSYPDVQQVKVAMRPARPQAFGYLGRLFWYALPGNPVSAWVAFDTLVRPFLLAAMGHRRLFRAPRQGVCESRLRSPARVREFVRAGAAEQAGIWRVRRVGPEGSGNLRSVVAANAFLVIPEGCEAVQPGDQVRFELFDDPPRLERPA
jgi:molybdopterin molybdotransferase